MKTRNRKMTFHIRTKDQLLGCTLTMDSAFRFETSEPCVYDRETAAYAACRYIRHCPALRDCLIYEAVKLGLTPKGRCKGRRHIIKTTASALELPGGKAALSLVVKQGTIVIEKLSVSAASPVFCGSRL